MTAPAAERNSRLRRNFLAPGRSFFGAFSRTCKTAYVLTFALLIPPPLTPPHKGEGDCPAQTPRPIISVGDWQRRQRRKFPPPCGERLGARVPDGRATKGNGPC